MPPCACGPITNFLLSATLSMDLTTSNICACQKDPCFPVMGLMLPYFSYFYMGFFVAIGILNLDIHLFDSQQWASANGKLCKTRITLSRWAIGTTMLVCGQLTLINIGHPLVSIVLTIVHPNSGSASCSR